MFRGAKGRAAHDYEQGDGAVAGAYNDGEFLRRSDGSVANRFAQET